MKIVYIGPSPGVEIGDVGIVAPKGQPVEVDDKLARRLLEQPTNWKRARQARGKDDG